jgi:Xaa-Pro aminopeptidase
MLNEILKTNGLDAVVLFHLPHIRFLCGFTGTDGALVVTANDAFFLTDSRYTTQARSQVKTAELVEYRQKVQGVARCLCDQEVARVGFESATLPYGSLMKLQEETGVGCAWVPLDDPLQQLRRCKTPAEVTLLKQAASLAATAFEQVVGQIRPGAVERDIALELEFAIKRLGGEEKSFDFIVASGPRGAMPHGLASDKRIQAGELVTVDYGARKNGYHSDETVTMAVGEINSDLRRIYDIVLAAHDRAIELLRPGMSLKALDAVARELIDEAGYADYFGHGLGHGVGLEIHEYPAISPRATGKVEPGMVLTIEPGIYLPDLGGVRIEDMVLVTDDGCEILTQLPKAFRRLD